MKEREKYQLQLIRDSQFGNNTSEGVLEAALTDPIVSALSSLV